MDRRFKDGENPEDYSFIQSLVSDNTALMKAQPDYIKQLEALPPKLKQAWLYGKWDIFDGQFFEDFKIGNDKEKSELRFTHVIKPFDISRGESVADTAARYGVYFTPGDNKRIAGWMQCHYRLQFDSEGYPRMYVFENCRAFIRTVPLLSFSASNPEDLDTSGEDHAADEWRYFCMDRPIRPIVREEKRIISDPLNMLV